jgi:hypothetical protein
VTGARERKRAERQKRKRRSAESVGAQVEAQPTPAAEAPGTNSGGDAETFEERMARRYEERNAEARGKLHPLEQGERPGAVTVGAVVSTVIALVFTVSTVLAIAGVKADGREINPAPLVLVAAVAWAMAIGMWRTRYWAVLGFQTVLLFVLLASGVGLVRVSTVPEALVTVALLIGAGLLFYFMIRAMARIQMPSPPRAH